MEKANRLLKLLAWGLVVLPLGAAQGASDLRNPFSFPPGVQKGGGGALNKEGIGPDKEGKEAIPVFRLTTILVSGQTRVAAINGVLLRKGEELSGFRVAEIEEKQVVLAKGKERLVLKFDPMGKHSPMKNEVKK